MWLEILSIILLAISTFLINQNVPPINEKILSETENAYNPIPSPDGKTIAYIETGWYRKGGTGGNGRSNLKSNVKLMDSDGNVLSKMPLTDAFLYGWTSDSKNLIAYRDNSYGLIPTDATNLKLTPFEIQNSESNEFSDKSIIKMQFPSNDSEFAERIAYLEKENLFLWLKNEWTSKQDKKEPNVYHRNLASATLKTPQGNFLSFEDAIDFYDVMLVTSPNERYIAMFGVGRGENSLQIYDRQNKRWTQLGKIIVHPDRNWDYINLSWNPWFSDSSKLVFISNEGIVTSSPDGKNRKIISSEKNNVGIPVPSPDGKMIAYATFELRPMEIRPVYGGTTIWIKNIEDESSAKSVTRKSEDKTYTLSWLNNQEVVFDRIADESSYNKARIWKAKIQN